MTPTDRPTVIPIVAIAIALFGAHPTASAQLGQGLELTTPSEPVTPHLLGDDERFSIQREASVASGLYVTAAIALGVGAILEVAALVMVLTGAPAHGAGDLKMFELLGAIGGVVGGIGAIALPLAIGLHVDSHSRHDALDRSRCASPPRLQVAIGLTRVALVGQF
ncbi:MAG: hypothetical protein KF729_39120 [Sandaracinaceae bacterium]|nr:hypothetical protein [Sandaracinaceae bacterium]